MFVRWVLLVFTVIAAAAITVAVALLAARLPYAPEIAVVSVAVLAASLLVRQWKR